MAQAPRADRDPGSTDPSRHESSNEGDDQALDGARYDVVIVGAGVCGVIFLKYAREQGLSCVALEKQNSIGGLWNWIPSWQDIQNRIEDFAINGVPLHGTKQPDVIDYLRAWVDKYNLASDVKLGCEVTSTAWEDGAWRVRTNRGTIVAKHLVAASGAQNDPVIPAVDGSGSEVHEVHSSELRRPEDLAGRRVTVVGGGASAWDLLDLAIQQGAEQIHWVCRTPRWFLPSTRAKEVVWPNLRELAITQTVLNREAVNAFFEGLLRKEYDRFEVTEIEPAEPFDIAKHMLTPGRSTLIQNLSDVSLHRSQVRGIDGHEVALDNGERFPTDLLLWATGYRLNLEYLDLPAYSQIRSVGELYPRLGSLVRSNDYPNLFFVGMTLANTTSSTPFFAAIEAKTIVAHMTGRCEIPRENVPRQIAHWRLFNHFAGFDRANYRPFWWRIRYTLLALWYGVFGSKSVNI